MYMKKKILWLVVMAAISLGIVGVVQARTVIVQQNDIISGIAKKNNFTLVLDSQAVIYANDTTNITKEVSKEFDKK